MHDGSRASVRGECHYSQLIQCVIQLLKDTGVQSHPVSASRVTQRTLEKATVGTHYQGVAVGGKPGGMRVGKTEHRQLASCMGVPDRRLLSVDRREPSAIGAEIDVFQLIHRTGPSLKHHVLIAGNLPYARVGPFVVDRHQPVIAPTELQPFKILSIDAARHLSLGCRNP